MVKRMIKKHFKFQTWHAMWSSGLHIYLLLTSGSSRWLVFERIFSNNHEIHDRYEKKWKNERSKGIFNFKRDMLCEVQGSISSFFWLQGPPDVLYLKEYSQIIMTFIINMIRNGKKEDQNASKISNVTCYVKFRFFISTFFDFKVLQMTCIWKNILKYSWPSW